MGYIRHDAIIATSWEGNHLKAAHSKAKEIGLTCSEIVDSPINSYQSFMIVPDGSKEGWGDSDKGIAMRSEWIAWVRNHGHSLESACRIDWAHINFGGDDDKLSTLADHSGISLENA